MFVGRGWFLCPNVSHHPNIGDISSPTDTAVCETNLNGNFRILKWNYVVPYFKPSFVGILPYIGLILQALYMASTSSESVPVRHGRWSNPQAWGHFSFERVGHGVFVKIVELNEGLSSHAYQRISMNHHFCPIYRISFHYTPQKIFTFDSIYIPFMESKYYTIGYYQSKTLYLGPPKIGDFGLAII